MTTLEELSRRRASAKGQVTLKLKHLASLLELRGADAIKRSSEVSQYHNQLYDKVKVFREAHEQYSEQLLASTKEEDLDSSLKTLDDYYREVDTKFYECSKKYDVFKTECDIIGLKEDLEVRN